MTLKHFKTINTLAVVMVAFSAGNTCAQSSDASAASSVANSQKGAATAASNTDVEKKKGEITGEDRDKVLAFAKEHHPELAGLLEQLEKSRPNEFSKAVRELRQQVQVLDRVRERSPAKYEEQLASWKRDSQIRLLMARWAKKNDPAIEVEIRALLKVRREARLAQLKADRERVNQQQRKLDEQLLEFEQPMDEQVGEEWNQLAKRNRKPKNDK